MQVFNLAREATFDPQKHVEKILGKVEDGDVTEIYFCFEGGGTMRTPVADVAVVPGAFVVHPPGEVHEYANGPQRTLLFRVRYGTDMAARHLDWRGRANWKQSAEDTEYYRLNPPRPATTA